jgi:hypothetical protein
MKHALLIPMAVYIFYIWGVAIFMFISRLKGIREGTVSPKYFKAYLGPQPPERLVLIADHYQNQFEVPVLFLITCVLFIALDAANYVTLALAWFFVVSRGVHAWIHLGRNKIQRRAAAFAVGWAALLAMWVQLLIDLT